MSIALTPSEQFIPVDIGSFHRENLHFANVITQFWKNAMPPLASATVVLLISLRERDTRASPVEAEFEILE